MMIKYNDDDNNNITTNNNNSNNNTLNAHIYNNRINTIYKYCNYL